MVQPGVYVMRYDVFAWRFTRPTAIAYLQRRRTKGGRGKGWLVAAIVNIYLSYKIHQKKKRKKKKPQRAEHHRNYIVRLGYNIIPTL